MRPPPSLEAEGATSLDVVVHDGVDGPLLAGARVVAFAVVDGQAYLAGSGSTGPDGRVALPRVPLGEVWVLVDAPERARASSHLVLDSSRRSLAFHLAPEHVVLVDVRDELGAPVNAAEVEVTPTGGELAIGARTGADGRARVGRLGAGPWSVSVRAGGYEEGFARIERDGDSAVLVVRRLGSFEVHVIAEDGQPAAGAHVSLAGALLWPARSADTDAGGQVRVGGLAAGVYALRATRGNGVSPIEVGLALERGEARSVELRLAPGRWVAVRVVEDDADSGQGIGSARVSLVEGGLSPFPIEGTTDSKGRVRLGPIAVGTAALGARADGFVSRGGLPLPEPLPAEVTVSLVRAGALIGRVVDERGQPVDGATVEVVGTDPSGAPIFDDPRRASFQAAHFDALLAGPAPLIADGQLGVMPGPVPPIPQAGAWLPPNTMTAMPAAAEPWVTRGDGTFRAFPASPGRVRAVVRHPQYIEAESEIVNLSAGGEARVQVVMRQGGALEGRVVDAQDRPVGGVRVRAAAAQGSIERTTRTASDGTFAFAALPDEVSLTAEQDGDDRPGLRVSVSVPEGERKEITLKLPEARGPLPVRVVDDRGFPIESAEIQAVAMAPEVSLRTTAFTDANGEATLRRAGGVALRVEASAPGHAPRVLTTDGSAASLRIVLTAGETIDGRVVAALNGQAIQDAQVTLYTDLAVRRTRTDADGNFTLSELGAGQGRVSVRAAHFASVTRPIAVPDWAGRRPFDVPVIELPEEGIVEGEVVDGRGEPVSGARVAQDHVPTWMLGAASGEGMAITDSRGHFALGELGEGQVALEAYSAELGRGRLQGVAVGSGRTTFGARIVIVPEGNGESMGASEGKERSVAGSVAVTLGETAAPVQVVVVSVAPGSEAERGGLLPGDVILAIDGQSVDSMSAARQRLDGALSDDVVVHLQRGGRDLSVRVAREPVHR